MFVIISGYMTDGMITMLLIVVVVVVGLLLLSVHKIYLMTSIQMMWSTNFNEANNFLIDSPLAITRDL